MKMADEFKMEYDKLHDLALTNAADYLRLAIQRVDILKAEDGGSKGHPELVAALVTAAATEFNSMMLSHRVAQVLMQLEKTAADLGDSARKIRRAVE